MKIIGAFCFLFFLALLSAQGQKIVVDSSFTNDYIKKEALQPASEEEEKVESLGDLAAKIGEGIWKRLKYRLNLEGVKETLEAKKEKYVGTKEEDDDKINTTRNQSDSD